MTQHTVLRAAVAVLTAATALVVAGCDPMGDLYPGDDVEINGFVPPYEEYVLSETNLFANGGFEDDFSEWSGRTTSIGRNTYTITTNSDLIRSGSKALRSRPASGNYTWTQLSTTVTVETDKQYVFSMWVKAQNTESGTLFTSFYSSADVPDVPSGTFDWQLVWALVNPTDDTFTLSFGAGDDNTGSAYVDDIKLREVISIIE